jgi:hypothetical protein
MADPTAKATKPRGSHKATTAAIYQLKITLLGSDPAIWRRVLVSGDISLETLHWVIQHAMGWTNSHLHQFIVGKKFYSDPSFELGEMGGPPADDEFKVTLSEIAPKVRAKLVYEYDFGDRWEHEVRVEKVLQEDSRYSGYPVCIEGERACPPEDCGGIYGYYDSFLPAIQDPEHEEHEDMLEWAGGKFDPDAFDIKAVNKELKRLK